ncbi:Uncharacterised protein [uncultured archaeon]|nr:Uncharacterised protein [uncultured archaeon]
MDKLLQSALIMCLVIACVPFAIGEVEKMNFGTDASWKVIDFENQGWTSEDYDDSWWEPALVRGWSTGNLDGSIIWYPGKVTESTEYFRGTLEIQGADIIYGTLDAGVNDKGAIELYLNNNSIGTVKTDKSVPTRINITSYLKPGKNVIAAKVTVPSDSGWGWGLSGIVRYNR